ncbi:MAG: uncharacterized protein KVP18_001890 [Porospora cf. gigantea A]|uniref:uncharacterized protein n=1 Tax=Porospora cf. gigantea A TaxID=2853593 RepID=UPI0035598CD1|nr:MAG: hypothetical protein KVP18_001890 [Porospora cf. gigantea A]
MPKVTPPVRSTSRSVPNYGKPTVASRARQGITPVCKSAARTTSRAKRPSYLRRAEKSPKLGDTSKVSVTSHGRKIKTPREDPRSTPGLPTSLIPETADSTPVSWSTEFPDVSRHRPQCDEEIEPLLPLLEPGRFYCLTSRRSAAGLVCPRCKFCLDMAPLQLYVGRRGSDAEQRPLTRSPYMPSNLPMTPTESLYDPQTLRESMASIERDIRRFEEARDDEEFMTPAYVFEEADFSYVSPGKGPLFSSRLKPLHVPPEKSVPPSMEPSLSASPKEPLKSASPKEPSKSASFVELSKSSFVEPSKSASFVELSKSASFVEPSKSASPMEPSQSASPMEPTKRATLAEEGSMVKKHLTKPKLRRGSITFNSISAWDTLGLTPLRASEKLTPLRASEKPRVVHKEDMKQPSPSQAAPTQPRRQSLLLPASVSRPSSLESSSPFRTPQDSNTPLAMK